MKKDGITIFHVEREFVLRQPIGDGAFGEVHDAFEPETGQEAAVKILKADYIDDSDACGRFRDEAVVAASIDHPTGLPIYGAGACDDGRPFYVMKKVRGRTLENLLRERGKQVSDQDWLFRLLRIFLHVCEGVAAAHGRGFVHRDLKPENIVVSDQDFVTVLDWGLARRYSPGGGGGATARTVAGAVMGSPGYMSPEQARGESAKTGPQADVFALGVVLYRILTDIRPFEGQTPRESVLGAIYREPEDPRRLNPWISRRLAAVCRKAIRKNPDQRYADAGEFAKDLHAYMDGRDVSVARMSIRERLRSLARRSPGRALLTAALGAAVFLAAATVGGQYWLDENLVEKAFENVAKLDAENSSIRDRLKTLGAGDPDAAKHERQMLHVRHFLNNYEILVLLEDVVRLRYIRTSPETVAAWKIRLLNGIREAMEMGEPGIASVMIQMAREHEKSSTARIRFSAAELERLDSLEKQVGAAMLEESRENKP